MHAAVKVSRRKPVVGRPVMETLELRRLLSAGSISGIVFNDVNGNWSHDSGEPLLAGWTVYIDANKNGKLDSGEVSTTTNAQGQWSIGNLAAGTYQVREVVKSGFRPTAPGPFATVTVGSSNVGNINFGNTQKPYIAGTVFNDANGDGTQDNGETGMAGVTVYVDLNNDGKLDAGDVSTTTDSHGNFAIYTANAGSYPLREVVPTGFTVTKPGGGVYNISPANAAVVTGLNFGNKASGSTGGGSISGIVFNDMNGNWSHDSGEPLLAGWTVYIDANKDGKLDAGDISTTTNAQGQWGIGNLPAGTYQVREIVQAGFRPTVPGPFATVTLGSGSHVGNVNFGDTQKPYISGTVFNDANGDGTQDNGETGMAGVTVYLDLNNDGKLDAGDVSTTTDSHGNFALYTVNAGSYPLREVVPSGFAATRPSGGVYNISPANGAIATGFNFGNKAITSPPPSGFIISSVRQTDSADPTKDIVTFFAKDPGTGVLAGTMRLVALDATLASPGGLEIRTYSNGDADFTGQNTFPTASYIGAIGTPFVAGETPSPTTGTYRDFELVPQFEVQEVVNFNKSGGVQGVLANTGQGAQFAVAVVPHGSAVRISGNLGAESGPELSFSYSA